MRTFALKSTPHEYCGGSQVSADNCGLLCQGQGKQHCLLVPLQSGPTGLSVHVQASDLLIAAAPINIKKQDLADLELGVSCPSRSGLRQEGFALYSQAYRSHINPMHHQQIPFCSTAACLLMATLLAVHPGVSSLRPGLLLQLPPSPSKNHAPSAWGYVSSWRWVKPVAVLAVLYMIALCLLLTLFRRLPSTDSLSSKAQLQGQFTCVT